MLLLMFGSTQTSRAEPILVTTVQVPGVLRFGHSQATPFVTATVTYQTDGFHLYQYVLSNPQPSDMPLAILQLDGLFGIPADHTQPKGWGYYQDRGYIRWQSDPPLLGQGSSATFSILSNQAPGQVHFAAAGWNGSFSDQFEGIVPGPADGAPALVPEPASAILLASAGLLLSVQHLRRRRSTIQARA